MCRDLQLRDGRPQQLILRLLLQGKVRSLRLPDDFLPFYGHSPILRRDLDENLLVNDRYLFGGTWLIEVSVCENVLRRER